MAITVKDNLIRERDKEVNPNIKVGIDADGRGYLINLDKVKPIIEEPKVIEEPKQKRGKKK